MPEDGTADAWERGIQRPLARTGVTRLEENPSCPCVGD